MKPDFATQLASLQAAAQELGLPLNSTQAHRLLAYRDMIAKWNKVYNLTSLRDPAQMLSHHIIDSLAAAAPLQKHLAQTGLAHSRLLDVGSGGGLPGVVLAAVLAGLDVTCVDTVGKKAAFVQQVANELTLQNLRGLHARVQDMQAKPFDVITSRAFSSLPDFVQLTRTLLKRADENGVKSGGGVWMALKGKRPDEEIAALPADIDVFHVEQLAVPTLEAERCIVWMRLRG